MPQALRSTTRRVEAIDDGHTFLTGPHGVRYGAIAIIVAVCAAGALGAQRPQPFGPWVSAGAAPISPSGSLRRCLQLLQADVHQRTAGAGWRSLMVLMTHNTDIADAWDREGEDRDFFYNLFPDGHAVGINVLPYDHGALTPCASDSEPRGRDCGKSVKYPVGV